MRAVMSICVLASLLGLAQPALAVPETESRKTIALLSLNGTTAAVGVDGATVSRNCAFGLLITFNPTTAMGRLFYATLLSANASNAAVTITYDRNGTTCTLTQVDTF